MRLKLTQKEPNLEVLSSQRGQAVVEYLLILIVMVGLIGGGLLRFHEGFGRYARNYVGDYLACLIETGELPNLGAPSGGICDDLFEPFSMAEGRPPVPGGAAPPSNRSEGNTQPPATSVPQARDAENSGRPAAAKVRRPRQRRALADQGGGSRGGAGGSRVTQKVPGAGFEEGGRRKKLKASKAIIDVSVNDNDREKKGNKSRVAKADDNDLRGKKKKMQIKAKREPAQIEEDEGWSFGKLIRYLIIAGIILAIVIFVGGQALQISKEWE